MTVMAITVAQHKWLQNQGTKAAGTVTDGQRYQH